MLDRFGSGATLELKYLTGNSTLEMRGKRDGCILLANEAEI